MSALVTIRSYEDLAIIKRLPAGARVRLPSGNVYVVRPGCGGGMEESAVKPKPPDAPSPYRGYRYSPVGYGTRFARPLGPGPPGEPAAGPNGERDFPHAASLLDPDWVAFLDEKRRQRGERRAAVPSTQP